MVMSLPFTMNLYHDWVFHVNPFQYVNFDSKVIDVVSFDGKKPKTTDNEECESSKQGSKKGDGRKAVNEIISKVVKERWDKKMEYEKKWQAILDTNPCSTCELETGVNDEDEKLYFR
ncbi:hypothetical protein Tco_1365150, partial [Tanacetum coccineum]